MDTYLSIFLATLFVLPKISLRGEIKNIIPNQLYEDVVRINDERKQQEQVRSRVRQRDKYYRLKYGQGYSEYQNDTTKTVKRSQSSSTDKSKWVVNISKRELSNIEEKVLQKGAGFAVADKKIQHDEFVTATQQASKFLSQSHSLALKAEVTDILKKATQNKSNLTKEELKAINNLKKEESIVITPADKGQSGAGASRQESGGGMSLSSLSVLESRSTLPVV